MEQSNAPDDRVQNAVEISLLSCLMRDRKAAVELAGITPRHFVDEGHAQAWKAMLDDMNVDDALALRIAAPALSEESAAAIEGTRHGKPTMLRARDRILEERARRDLRRAILKATEALDARSASSSSVAASLLADMDVAAKSGSMSTSAAIVAHDLRSQKRSEPIRTGIRAFDYVTYGGLWPGQMTGLLARYKNGKTTFAASIARNLERAGVPTLMVTLERRKNDIERFIIAQSLGIDARDLDLGEGGAHDEVFEQYLADRRNLWYIHRPAVTTDELRAMIIADVHAHGVKVVIVDYWQLITNKTSKASQQEKQQEAGQMLADLSSDLDVAILVMGQLNQEGQPRGGEGILAAAGIVVKLHRPEETDDGFLEGMVCNKGPVLSKGDPAHPSVSLVQPGPHFRDWQPAD